MCGRYYLDWAERPEEFQRIVEALNRKLPAEERERVKISGEIFPTDLVPALAGNQVVAMRWGFSLSDGRRPVINARWETAGEKPMFRGALASGRCLIPAAGYYEWRKADAAEEGPARRQKHALFQDAPVTYMAGLYRREAGNPFLRFVILTRPAADSIAFIHDRMPLLIPGQARREWLLGENPADVLSRAARENLAVRFRAV